MASETAREMAREMARVASGCVAVAGRLYLGRLGAFAGASGWSGFEDDDEGPSSSLRTVGNSAAAALLGGARGRARRPRRR